MGQVRVVLTRIEPDGTMHRRMVDTAQQSNPRNWEHLAARALAIHPPYARFRAPTSTTSAWTATSSRSASMTSTDRCATWPSWCWRSAARC
jgi:hypothetical protein